MLTAGQLKHRITIQRPVAGTALASGEVPITWANVRTVWAKVSPLSGREYWQAKAAQASTTHQVTMRWRDDVDSTMRLQFKSRGVTRYLYVAGPPINTDEACVELILNCVEQEA